VTRQEAQGRLKRAISDWQADNPADREAMAVCNRLTDSEAAISFAAVRPDGTRWEILLADCIIAERKMRSLWQEVAGAAEAEREAAEAAAALDTLTKTLTPRIVPISGQPDVIAAALGVVGDAIYSMRLSAARVRKERSRRADEDAARSAAIGWLREAVRQASGAKNHEHVRVLAEAATGHPVTLASVRKAVMPSYALSYGYSTAKAAVTHSLEN